MVRRFYLYISLHPGCSEMVQIDWPGIDKQKNHKKTGGPPAIASQVPPVYQFGEYSPVRIVDTTLIPTRRRWSGSLPLLIAILTGIL